MIIGCYARLSLHEDVKNVSMFLKIFVLFCPAGDIISVEKHHLFIPRPVRDKMFSSSHYVLDGTLVNGGILLLPICCPRRDKKTSITFLHPIWG